MTAKEQHRLKDILLLIQAGRIENLDVKKLKGHDDIFRVRKGNVRVIFRTNKDGSIKIIIVERRTDTTYHF